MLLSLFNNEFQMSVLEQKFRGTRFKLLLFILIVLFECILYYLTRQVQYEVRVLKSNLLINSFPSFNLTLGLPLALWVISNFTFKKALIIGLSVGIAHEFLRYIDDGIPVDAYDILFSLFGGLGSVLVYIFLIKIFCKKN